MFILDPAAVIETALDGDPVDRAACDASCQIVATSDGEQLVVRALLDDGRDVTITLSFAASEFAAAIQAAPAAEAAGAAA